MILKFDAPMDIREARLHYNDSVTFITSPESYPKVSSIEFNGDPKLIFKRDAIEPKVNKKLTKISKTYERKIARIWNRTFKEIKEALQSVSKAETFRASKEQKDKVHEAISGLVTSMADAAEKPYKQAYGLGKMRGQVLSGQEIDSDMTPEDETDMEDLLADNSKYLTNFGNDLIDGLDKTMDEDYSTDAALSRVVETKFKIPKLLRALMYAGAIYAALVAGTHAALKAAKPHEGHRVIKGGIWTIHPDEGLGGEVCHGCEENSGRWFSLEDFEAEYGNNNCLNRCRCDLRYGNQIIA